MTGRRESEREGGDYSIISTDRVNVRDVSVCFFLFEMIYDIDNYPCILVQVPGY